MSCLFSIFSSLDQPRLFLSLGIDYEFLKIAGQVAGIGGLAIIALLIVFRDVIRKNIFPTLGPGPAYRLLRLMIILVSIIAVLGIAAWMYSRFIETRSTGPTPVKAHKLSGVVQDAKGRGLADVTVSVIGGEEKYQTTSSGSFFLTIRREGTDEVRLQANKSGYATWNEVVRIPQSELVIRLEPVDEERSERNQNELTQKTDKSSPATSQRERKATAPQSKDKQGSLKIEQKVKRSSDGNQR